MNPIFRDLLKSLSDAGVEYLVVGGYAVAAHGLPRATGDLDCWVRRAPQNAARVMAALRAFGAPMAGLAAADFATADLVYQLGRPPNRIDLLTDIDGVAFDDAWPRRVVLDIEGVAAAVIGRADLIRNKRAVGRPQDLADAIRLERQANP